MMGIREISNSHSALNLLAGLFFLLLAVCYFPLLLLFIPFFFYPGPEPVIPLFAADSTVTSSPRAARQRERSPPQ
jgi:hypothetical protein